MNSINISIDLSLISSSFIPNKSDNDVFDCQIWMNFIQYKCDTRRKRGTINGSLKSMYDVIRHDLRQKKIDRLLRLVGFPSSVSFKFTRFLPGFPRVLREGGSGTGVGYGRSLEQGKGGRRDGDEGGGGGPRLPDWTNYIQWTSPEQQRQQQQAALGRRKKKRAKLRKKKQVGKRTRTRGTRRSGKFISLALGGPSRGFDRFGFRWRNIRVVNVDAPINGHRRPRPHRLFSVPFYQLLLGFNGCFSVLPYFTGYHWVWNGFCKVFFKNNSVVF